MDERLHRAAVAALHNCLAVQPDEQVTLLLPDPGFWAGPLFARAVEEADARRVPGAAAADVILCFTPAVGEEAMAAVARGARLAHMPLIRPETLARALFVDFKATAVLARHLASRLAEATEARLSADGLDLTLLLEGAAETETGILRWPGSVGQLPAGEARRGRLSLGCNEKAIIWGDSLEDRRARGAVAIDGAVVREATLLLDGVPLVAKGILRAM
jgi:hypothetical protein